MSRSSHKRMELSHRGVNTHLPVDPEIYGSPKTKETNWVNKSNINSSIADQQWMFRHESVSDLVRIVTAVIKLNGSMIPSPARERVRVTSRRTALATPVPIPQNSPSNPTPGFYA
jgi:hypothetical protein